MRSRIFIILTILAACCASLVLVATRAGPGITYDSTVYLAASKALCGGRGLVVNGKWLTHFPPLFPITLSLLSPIAGDPVRSARYLNAVLFAVNACLVWLLVFNHSRSVNWATLAAALFTTSNSLARIHGNVWSEPLFIAFVLFAVLRLQGGDEVSAAILLGLATITRWAGFGVILGSAAVLVMDNSARRTRRSIRFAAISLAFPLLVMILNRALAGNATNRGIDLRPDLLASRTIDGIRDIGTIVLPQSTPLPIKAFTLTLIWTLLFWLSRRKQFVRNVSALAAAHIAFVACSLLLADAAIGLDGRMLSPAICLVLIAGCCAIQEHWPTRGAVVLAVLFAIGSLLGLFRTFRWLI